MLIEHDLFRGRIDKVAIAIDRMRAFEPPEGYYLAYSGGKDSDTILALAKMAGVKFDAHYNLTTVDPPELVWHVKKHTEVEITRPKETMWKLIQKNGVPPTQLMRYCCKLMKEVNGSGRLLITGIRAEESTRRAKRNMVETCYQDVTKRYLHPIIDWTSEDVWEFIRGAGVDYCKLYDEGFERLGCVLCPFTSPIRKKRDAQRWPKITDAWHRAIIRVWEDRIASKKTSVHSSGEDMWLWWLSGKGKKEDGGLFT
jgi:phosphoadenosine phosphosulfate reductase